MNKNNNNDIAIIKVSEYIDGQSINWNGFYSYAQWLQSEKLKNNDNTILHYLNYFLLSPDLIEPDNIKYYYETLSLLSVYYCKANNLHGLDWAYHSLLRTQKTNKKASPQTQANIFFKYAHLLNSRDVYLSFAYKLLNEIGESVEQKIKDDYIKLKNEIIHKIIDRNYDQNFQIPPFELTEFEEKDDYWNPLLLDVDKSVEVYEIEKKRGQGKSNKKNNFFDMNDDDDIINKEDKTMNNNSNNSDALNQSIKKIKVLILVANKNIQTIPYIPRYIHYRNDDEFKEILAKLGITDLQQCFVFDEKNKRRQDLLYILYTFFNENKLLYFERANIDQFLSSPDNRAILIIAPNIKCEKVNESLISVPEALKPFLDVAFILKQLMSSKYIFNDNQLNNYGNTCLMNSGLECIFHCNLLTKYFQFDRYEKHYKTDNIIIQTFTELTRKFDKENVEKFMKTIQHELPKLKANEQNDQNNPHEFVLDILNVLSSGTCRAKYELHDPSAYPVGSGGVSWEKLLSKEASIITDLFYGQLQHKYTCNCGEKVNYEEFLLLNVPVPTYSINFKLFRLNNTNQFETIILDYHENKDLRCVYIKNQVRQMCGFTVDVLKMDIAKHKVKVIDDEDSIFDVGLLSNIFTFDKYVEVILYERPSDQGMPYYLVPCFDFIKKNKFIKQNEVRPEIIVNYPIQIFINKDNVNKSTYIKEALNKGLNNYEIINETKISDKNFIYEKELFNFNEVAAIDSFLKKLKYKTALLYFQSKDIKFSVNISQHSIQNLTIKHCLNRIYNTKSFDKCDKCNENKEKIISFSKLPHYLILNINRFYLDSKTNSNKKDQRKIMPLDTIKLEDSNHNEYTYNAFAINLHKGKMNKGTYYAKCKEKEGWLKFINGSSVTKTELKNSENVMHIFYEKQ